jgi:methionyl-tRNA formyltransferase
LSIAVCSDAGSWINSSIPQLLLPWLAAGHQCAWGHDARQLPGGDLCFYLSYGRIVDQETRSRYRNNLVVHESDLPQGKGWSPLTWQILEGKNRIPVTLIEAAERVDSGIIYAQDWLEFEGHELIDELRRKQASATVSLCQWFIANYPQSAAQGTEQRGKESFYPRRKPVDSKLDLNKSLAEQFHLLRVVDNERYPAFFEISNHKYIINVMKS